MEPLRFDMELRRSQREVLQFNEFLEQASAEVKTWPDWKRNIFGDFVKQVEGTKMSDILDRAKLKLAESYSGPGGAIDPNRLLDLLEIALKILQGCQQPAGRIKEEAANRTTRAQIQANRVTRRHLVSKYGLGAWFRYDGPRLAEAVLKAAGTSEESEIQELQDVR